MMQQKYCGQTLREKERERERERERNIGDLERVNFDCVA